MLELQSSSEKKETQTTDPQQVATDIPDVTQEGGQNITMSSQHNFLKEAMANKQELNQNQFQQIGNSSLESLYSQKILSSVNKSQQSSLQLPEFT